MLSRHSRICLKRFFAILNAKGPGKISNAISLKRLNESSGMNTIILDSRALLYSCEFSGHPNLTEVFHRSELSEVSEMSMLQGITNENLVWIDLEMTGLDVEKDKILEIACLVTNASLDSVVEGPDLIIHQPDSVLNSMNEWSLHHHAKSGLTEASRKSKTSLQEAEQQVLNFIKMHVPRGKCPLAGNSVYMDRIFLQRYMPELDKYLHYRIVDVSTIKELCRRWNPTVFSRAPSKVFCHRALSDIKESVKELKYYQTSFLRYNRR